MVTLRSSAASSMGVNLRIEQLYLLSAYRIRIRPLWRAERANRGFAMVEENRTIPISAPCRFNRRILKTVGHNFRLAPTGPSPE